MSQVATTDTGYAPSRWAFDGEVTRVFDDMLARSIPQYEVMRRAVFEVGSRFVRAGTDIVDLGCSRGEAMSPFIQKFGATCRYVGVEVSPPMLTAARERFASLINTGVVEIRDLDLRAAYPPVRASLTLAVLSFQFTPINYRQRLIRDAYEHTAPGGAFILVEKVLGAGAELDAIQVDAYHAMKAENGYSADDIERKRLALEGVLVPVTAHWNEELLRLAGFSQVDCFWRLYNFGGWIALKDK